MVWLCSSFFRKAVLVLGGFYGGGYLRKGDGGFGGDATLAGANGDFEDFWGIFCHNTPQWHT